MTPHRAFPPDPLSEAQRAARAQWSRSGGRTCRGYQRTQLYQDQCLPRWRSAGEGWVRDTDAGGVPLPRAQVARWSPLRRQNDHVAGSKVSLTPSEPFLNGRRSTEIDDEDMTR